MGKAAIVSTAASAEAALAGGHDVTRRAASAAGRRAIAAPSPSTVAKRYGSRPVVSGVSLALRRGEVVGLLGPNGAGKTTCFYMITGLIAPNEGRISLDGRDITGLPNVRAGRGWNRLSAPGAVGFLGDFRSRTTFGPFSRWSPSPRRHRESILDALLEEFAIGHLRDTLAVALSGGERRRWESPSAPPVGRNSSSSMSRLRASIRSR